MQLRGLTNGPSVDLNGGVKVSQETGNVRALLENGTSDREAT